MSVWRRGRDTAATQSVQSLKLEKLTDDGKDLTVNQIASHQAAIKELGSQKVKSNCKVLVSLKGHSVLHIMAFCDNGGLADQ